MSNQDDNSGKPPPPPGIPQIAPAKPLPRVTVPAAAPVAPATPTIAPAAPAAPSPEPARPFTPIATRPGAAARPPSRPLPTIAPAVPQPVAAPAVPPPAVAAPAAPRTPVIAPPVPGPAVAVAPAARAPVIAPPVPVPVAPAARPVAPPPAAPAVAPVARPPVIAPPVPVAVAPAARPVAPVIAPPVPAPVARPVAPALAVPPVAAPRPPGPPIAPPIIAAPGVAPAVAPAPVPPAAPAPFESSPSRALAPARPSPLAASGAIEQITPQQAGELRKLADGLDQLDYFQVLGLTQTANAGEIKKAFYRESRTYHPDRFFHLPPSQEKDDVGALYRRITEAYYVLRDDAKRKKYLGDLAGPDRAAKLRYTEATESELKAEARKVVEEEFGTHPKARPFFKSGMADYEKQNWQAAERNFKMGLTYEPGNARFKEKLAECQAKIEEQRRKQGPSFLIK